MKTPYRGGGGGGGGLYFRKCVQFTRGEFLSWGWELSINSYVTSWQRPAQYHNQQTWTTTAMMEPITHLPALLLRN
jgi:hypothetical protein